MITTSPMLYNYLYLSIYNQLYVKFQQCTNSQMGVVHNIKVAIVWGTLATLLLT